MYGGLNIWFMFQKKHFFFYIQPNRVEVGFYYADAEMCYCFDFDLHFPCHPLEFTIIYNFHTEKQWYECKKSLHFSSDST